jgi:hypothetical protein
MMTLNLARFVALGPASVRWIFDRCSARRRGIPLGGTVGLAVLCTALAAPAWAEEIAASRALLWLSDLVVPRAESDGNSASTADRVTLDEAIAVALDANHLAKKPARRRLVSESVIQAYNAARRAQRALAIREEALRMCRELDCLMGEQTERGQAAPSVVLQASAARARATSDVLRARQELDAQVRQLNHLMGRDPQARLVVTGEPGLTADIIRLGRYRDGVTPP